MICPSVMYGFSTCFAPSCSSTKKFATNSQNITRISGRNCAPRTRPVSSSGIASRISSEANIATTPASLLGIDRRIA